nr:MAG: hypothetical protein DIU52_14525 [bacterium]
MRSSMHRLPWIGVLRARTLAAAVVVALGAAAAPVAAQTGGEAAKASDVLRFTVAPEGNEARYRVREQLARLNFPNDAVGATSQIEGGITVRPDGTVVREESRFVIDLASLRTDSERRDNYVRRRTLETETYPTAVFVPTELRGLSFPLPTSGESTFEIVGDLTIRGVTRPTTWEVTARFEEGAVSGLAKTQFTFDDFQIEKPRVASVLSVADEIRLEYEFRLLAR